MSGLSPAARKELASLSPEERVEALRALVDWRESRLASLNPGRCYLTVETCGRRGRPRICPEAPLDSCEDCCDACACSDSEPL